MCGCDADAYRGGLARHLTRKRVERERASGGSFGKNYYQVWQTNGWVWFVICGGSVKRRYMRLGVERRRKGADSTAPVAKDNVSFKALSSQDSNRKTKDTKGGFLMHGA